jgi:hypothetical protein
MATTEQSAADSAVTWAVFPDRDTDRIRLTVLHLAAGIPGLLGVALLGALVFVIADGVAGENVGSTVLVVVLLFIGGPVSLVYILLAVGYGTDREVARLAPPVGWVRLRYLPLVLLGAGIVLLLPVIRPELLLVYVGALVACKMVVDLRYTVGRLDPETASLWQVSGAAAADYTGNTGLDPDDRQVRTFDISPLERVHERQVGNYTIFFPRYRSRGRWGRPLVFVVPNDTAAEVETALDTVIRTHDWTPGDGLTRAVRIVLGGLGVVFLGATGGFVAVGADVFPIVAYVAATLGALGAAMLYLAIRG